MAQYNPGTVARELQTAHIEKRWSRTEPWKPEDTVQAVLLDGGAAILTTHAKNDDTWIQVCRGQQP